MLTIDFTEFADLIVVVVVWYKARLAWTAVLAQVNWGAFDSVIVSSSLIDGASLISNFISVHELEGTEAESSIAAIIC